LNRKIMGRQTPKGDQELIDNSSSYNEEISEEENEPPADEEEEVDKAPTSPVGSGGKLWMSTYNVLYLGTSTYELDTYKDRGTPQPMKHMRAIHEKYCQLIDRVPTAVQPKSPRYQNLRHITAKRMPKYLKDG